MKANIPYYLYRFALTAIQLARRYGVEIVKGNKYAMPVDCIISFIRYLDTHMSLYSSCSRYKRVLVMLRHSVIRGSYYQSKSALLQDIYA